MMLMRNLRYRTTPAAMMVHRYPINLYALLGAAGGTTEEASRERENGRQSFCILLLRENCRRRPVRSSHVQLESVIGNDDMRGCGAELFTQPLIATTKGATGGVVAGKLKRFHG